MGLDKALGLCILRLSAGASNLDSPPDIRQKDYRESVAKHELRKGFCLS